MGSFAWSGVGEYLLGLRTEAGAEDEERFLVFFFCELVVEVETLSGEEGFDFFLAGEVDGDISESFA